jgi:DNA-binding transcriptional ArsR family regulator
MENKNSEDIYKAFSNYNRVKLLVCLSKPKSVTELLSLCTLSQSALSQHLKVLKDIGMVVCTRDGKQQIYCVKNKKILKVATLLLELQS